MGVGSLHVGVNNELTFLPGSTTTRANLNLGHQHVYREMYSGRGARRLATVGQSADINEQRAVGDVKMA